MCHCPFCFILFIEVFGYIFHPDTVFEREAYFICHSSCYSVTEIPQLVAFQKQRESGIYAELSVLAVVIIEKLRKVNQEGHAYG